MRLSRPFLLPHTLFESPSSHLSKISSLLYFFDSKKQQTPWQLSKKTVIIHFLTRKKKIISLHLSKKKRRKNISPSFCLSISSSFTMPGIDQSKIITMRFLVQKDYFGILKVPNGSPLKVCNRAWRKLTLKYHPDKTKTEDTWARLNEAYE